MTRQHAMVLVALVVGIGTGAAGWPSAAAQDAKTTRCMAFVVPLVAIVKRQGTLQWEHSELPLPLPPGWTPVGGAEGDGLPRVVACKTE